MSGVRRVFPLVTGHRSAFWWTLVSNLLVQTSLLALALLGSLMISLALTGDPRSVEVVAAALLPLALLCAVMTWRESYVAHDLAYRILADLRTRIFATLRRALPVRHDPRRSGDLGAVALADVEALEWLFAHTVAQVLTSTVMVAITTALSLIVSPWLILAWGPGLVVVLAMPWIVAPASLRRGRDLNAANAALHADVVETVDGLTDLAAADALQRHRRRLAAASATLAAAQRRVASIGGIEAAVSDVVVALSAIASLAVVASRPDRIDPALAPVAFTLAVVALGPVAGLAALLRNLGTLRSAADRVASVIDLVPAVIEPSSSPGPVRGALVVEDVSFRYRPDGPDVLSGVSFTVEPGEIVALVGPSGGGKSTCASLVLRLWDPDAGRIRIGGTDLRDLADDDLRRSITAVPQDIDLFSGTVAGNIRLARPDATPAQVADAARAVGLLDPGAGLHAGIDTVIGERGAGLSGGQRARVALARALLTDAPVLVLDEALAHLDAHAEAEMIATIRRNAPHRTVLLVAHRATTVRLADRVITLDHGTVRP